MWLGAPLTNCSAPVDAYSSFIGGVAHWLRRPQWDASHVSCPSCGKHDAVRLLTQMYVPLGDMDRVLYIFHCSRCGEKDKSFVFVLRCMSFAGRVAGAEQAATGTPQPPTGPMFAEDDDWGDGEGVPPPAAVTKPVAAAGSPPAPAVDATAATAPQLLPPDDLCAGQVTSSKCDKYPFAHLDIFEEPAAAATHGSLEEQLREVEARAPGAAELGMGCEEEDDDAADVKRESEFFDAIALEPSQVVRWHPGGEPLLSTLDPVATGRCSCCGAPRRFECQLMPPLIYFLTRDVGEARNELHFSTALVFTCSQDCYSLTLPYVTEGVCVQREL